MTGRILCSLGGCLLLQGGNPSQVPRLVSYFAAKLTNRWQKLTWWAGLGEVNLLDCEAYSGKTCALCLIHNKCLLICVERINDQMK